MHGRNNKTSLTSLAAGWMMMGWMMVAGIGAAASPEYSYHFLDTAQGWRSVSTVAFTPPLFQEIPNEPGLLSLKASRNENTFGYWESPVVSLQTDGSVYTADYFVYSAVSQPWRAPQLRLRTTPENFQQSAFIAAESRGDGAWSPDSSGRWYTHSFIPVPGGEQARMQFEILNFDPGDDPQGDLQLDAVNITRRPPEDLQPRTLVKNYTFGSSREGWKEATVPGFPSPNLGYASGSLRARGQGRVGEFAYWYSSVTNIDLNSSLLYVITFTVSTDLSVENRTKVPQFRLRANEETLHASSVLTVESKGDSSRSPASGFPQDYVLLFHPPAVANGQGLVLSWDYMNFDPKDAASSLLRLENVRVESVPYPW